MEDRDGGGSWECERNSIIRLLEISAGFSGTVIGRPLMCPFGRYFINYNDQLHSPYPSSSKTQTLVINLPEFALRTIVGGMGG